MFWRALTDNDLGNNATARLATWKEAGERMSCTAFEIHEKGNKVLIETTLFDHVTKAEVELSYQVLANGALKVSYQLKADNTLPQLPRVGMHTLVSSDLKTVEWLGRGPHENYNDRKTSAFVGHYSGQVWEQFFPYVRPQETGYKTDVRWISMLNKEGNGLLVSSTEPICANVLPFEYKALYHKKKGEPLKHGGSLQEGEVYSFFIDYGQTGVGGDNSWGAQVHPEYCLPAQTYNYTFTIIPVFKSVDLLEVGRKSFK